MLEANLNEFLLVFIMLLLMTIIMCCIVGVEIVLVSLVKARRIWNLRLRSCMNRHYLNWLKVVFIGLRLFRCPVGGNIVLLLLRMDLFLVGD